MYINFCERDDRVKEYLKRYRGHALLVGLLVFLLHGAKLNSDIIGIDTEDLIFWGKDFYGGWLHTGRHGLVFLKHLFGNTEFNPYFTGIVTLLLFTAAVSLLLGLWDRTGGKTEAGLAWGCGSLLWISHPAMAEQFYFSLQSMEICLAVFLTASALYLSYRGSGKYRLLSGAGSVCLLVLTFSCYQTFVVLYIFGAVSLLLLQALREVSEGKAVKGSSLMKRAVPYGLIFAAAFLINTLITNLFFSTSGYLGNQIYWGKASVKDCLHAIVRHVVRAFTGSDSVFYNAGLGALAIFCFVLLILFLRSRAGAGRTCVILFFYLAVLGTPFLMTLILGGQPAVRSQLVLPALTGFLGYLGVSLTRVVNQQPLAPADPAVPEAGAKGQGTWQTKILSGCAVVICLAGGISQAKVTEGLYYTDRCRYEQDAALGREIIARIGQLGEAGEGLPLVVVGGKEFTPNNACVTGEVTGRSFFNYDRDVEPEYYWNTRRVVGFLHTLGADYEQVPEEQVWEAAVYSEDMPVWPAEGSVRAMEGMVIVKLSGD